MMFNFTWAFFQDLTLRLWNTRTSVLQCGMLVVRIKFDLCGDITFRIRMVCEKKFSFGVYVEFSISVLTNIF